MVSVGLGLIESFVEPIEGWGDNDAGCGMRVGGCEGFLRSCRSLGGTGDGNPIAAAMGYFLALLRSEQQMVQRMRAMPEGNLALVTSCATTGAWMIFGWEIPSWRSGLFRRAGLLRSGGRII